MNDDEAADIPAERLDPVVSLLSETKPVPAKDFRTALGYQLTEEDPGWGSRPDRLWASALALISVGVLLLLIGALLSVGGI